MKRIHNAPLQCPCCGQSVDAVRDPERVLGIVAMPLVERRLADRLVQSFGRWVSADALIDAMHAGRWDGGPDDDRKNLHVRIHCFRQRLTFAPLKIETEAGRGSGGYRLAWREERAA